MKATRKLCDAPDCDRFARTRFGAWCELHYNRLRKHGTLDIPHRTLAKDLPCAGDNCSAPAAQWFEGVALCGTHKARALRHGSPNKVSRRGEKDGLKRLMSYVEKTDTCWLWRGLMTWDGYGLFSDKGYRTGAHRHAYLFLVGPIPEGLQLDHLCRVRNCVNPDHLEPVTPEENIRRAIAANQTSLCPRGHETTRSPSGSKYCPTCRHDQYERRKVA